MRFQFAWELCPALQLCPRERDVEPLLQASFGARQHRRWSLTWASSPAPTLSTMLPVIPDSSAADSEEESDAESLPGPGEFWLDGSTHLQRHAPWRYFRCFPRFRCETICTGNAFAFGITTIIVFRVSGTCLEAVTISEWWCFGSCRGIPCKTWDSGRLFAESRTTQDENT